MIEAASPKLAPHNHEDLALRTAKSLDPSRKKKVAEQTVADLPPEDKEELAAHTVETAGSVYKKKALVQAAAEKLPPEAKAEISDILAPPDPATLQRIWYIVVATLAAAIFVLIYQKKGAEVPLGLATTALGGIAGLIATKGRHPS